MSTTRKVLKKIGSTASAAKTKSVQLSHQATDKIVDVSGQAGNKIVDGSKYVKSKLASHHHDDRIPLNRPVHS